MILGLINISILSGLSSQCMTDRSRGPLKAVNAIKKNNIDSSALPAGSN